MMKAFLDKALDFFGVFRILIAILSVGVSHNFAFMMNLPLEFWSLIDATFLSGVTLQYLLFLSGTLFLSVFTAQMLAVARSAYLGIWVKRLERRYEKRLYPSEKRERYFDQVRRTIDDPIAPIARFIVWCLPIAIIGYYYAGWFALISLPTIIGVFSISVPILYPNLNFDIKFVDSDDEGMKNQNAGFWMEFFSDVDKLKQLTAFTMSAVILLSGYLGIVRHSHLESTAQFEFLYAKKIYRYSLIGNNARGYVVYDADSGAHILLSYGDVSMLRAVQ